MVAPAQRSVLTSPSAKFTWTSVANVDQYRLTMGSSLGSTDYFDDIGSNLTTTTDTVPNVPCDGRPVYVQLFTKLDGYWLPAQQYTYTAPTQCAAMLSPASGSTLAAGAIPFSSACRKMLRMRLQAAPMAWNSGMLMTSFTASARATASTTSSASDPNTAFTTS